MELILREMEAGEARAVQSLGIRSFLRSLEGFFVTKPKTALVAEKDGKIVGGFLYAIETRGAKKLGFVDFFFVEPAYAGQGIGRALCDEGVARLWAQGCDYLATFVRDDNVGSWAAFEKTGFARASLPKVAGALGLGGFVKTYLKHLYGLCTGCDLYFAARPDSQAPASDYAKKTGISQLALHVLTNTMLVLIPALVAFAAAGASSAAFSVQQFSMVSLSLLIVFGGAAVFGYIGALISRRKWRYRMPSGGLPLSFIFSVIGGMLYPVAGNWYPDRYENTPKFRKDMGISAILPWLYMIALLVAARQFGIELPILSTMPQIIIAVLLVFRCVPFPHVNLGAVRVFRWNKVLYGVMVLASIFFAFFW